MLWLCLHDRWRLTCVLDVEVRGLGPGSVPSQRGGPDPHRVVPRMHHSQLAATGYSVNVPGYTVVQLLWRTTPRLRSEEHCEQQTTASFFPGFKFGLLSHPTGYFFISVLCFLCFQCGNICLIFIFFLSVFHKQIIVLSNSQMFCRCVSIATKT